MSGGKKQIQTTSQTTNQTSQATPYAPAQAGIDAILADAGKRFGRGGPKVYAGDRVANLNADHLTSFGRQRQIADGLAAQGPNPGIAKLEGLIGDNGLTARQDATLNHLQGIATGDPLNPYLRQLIDDQAGELTDDLNRQFAGAGRLGSYSNADAVGDAVGDYRRGALFQGYDMGMGHKLAASDQVIAGDQGGVSNMLAASQMLPNLQAADTNAKLLGANLYGQIGDKRQTQQQKEIDARKAAFDERQVRPYQNLQWYSGMVNPLAQAFGTNTSHGTSEGTSTTEQKTPGWQTALGLGMTGLSLFGGGGPFSGMFSGGGMFGSSAPPTPAPSTPYMPYMPYMPMGGPGTFTPGSLY